jgi:quercetin dioxygenase-like cupin family protein
MVMNFAPIESGRVIGGVVVREYKIAKGSYLRSHAHPHDHLSVLLSGEAILTVDGKSKTLKGPCMVEIKGGIEHMLTAVTDCAWDCLWSLEHADEAVMRGVE